MSRRLQADLCIIGLSAIWGCTFVVIKRALDDVSPLFFVAARFTIAALPLLLLVPRGALLEPSGPLSRRIRLPVLRGGGVTGLLLFAGFACQTLGIQHTTPARSAFITGMYIIFTPLLSILLRIRRPSASSFGGALLAVTGLYLLTGPGGEGSGFGRGELLTLLCAVAFAGHLIAVDHYTRRHDSRAIAFLQVAAVALLASAITPATETIRFVPTTGLLAALAVTSLVGTALAFLVLNLVQAWTTPTRAAIIFAAEPVFAALTSWLVEGEILDDAALLGAGLILIGMLTTELDLLRHLRRRQAA